MKNFKKIVGINLLVLLIYTAFIYLNSIGQREAGLEILVLSAFTIGIHVSINLIISITFFIKGDNELGKSYLAACGLVLLIGFSTCFGGTALV